MTPIEFALLEAGRLLEHEEIEPLALEALVKRLRLDGVVRDPIWVALGSLVILNGHHRFRALRALGARRVPAWVLDYDDAGIVLERWSAGPAISKSEVLARARSGVLFPPKTTRHLVRFELPSRPTRLEELLEAPVGAQASSGGLGQGSRPDR